METPYWNRLSLSEIKQVLEGANLPMMNWCAVVFLSCAWN